jgi:serine-type D-Ala-D-Ala carboxypeptidase (penicillin-binding protein 5/6)
MNNLFSKPILKIFIFSFLLIFLSSMAMNSGFRIDLNFFNNDNKDWGITKDKVKSLLKVKPNTFELEKQSSFIQPAFADDIKANPTAYIIVDAGTGKVIAEKNSGERLPIASITKTMTAIVALDLADPNEKFLISERAANQIPTKIGVIKGEQMRLEELLAASILTSANDATQVIKEGVDTKYGEKVFIRAMNLKALNIGLKNTSFSNPQGFDGQYNFSTAEDLAVITHYALNNYPLIRDLASKNYMFLPQNEDHKQFDLYNWNGLIGVYPGVFGLKIGNTEDAGKTTTVAATREGKTIIAVVLGANDILERDLWAAELLDYGFEQAYGLKRVEITEEQLREKYTEWNYTRN